MKLIASFLILILSSSAFADMPSSFLQVMGYNAITVGNLHGYEIVLSHRDRHLRRPHPFEIHIQIMGEEDAVKIAKVQCADGLTNNQDPETNGRMAVLRCIPNSEKSKYTIQIFPSGPGPFEIEIMGKRIAGATLKLN